MVGLDEVANNVVSELDDATVGPSETDSASAVQVEVVEGDMDEVNGASETVVKNVVGASGAGPPGVMATAPPAGLI